MQNNHKQLFYYSGAFRFLLARDLSLLGLWIHPLKKTSITCISLQQFNCMTWPERITGGTTTDAATWSEAKTAVKVVGIHFGGSRLWPSFRSGRTRKTDPAQLSYQYLTSIYGNGSAPFTSCTAPLSCRSLLISLCRTGTSLLAACRYGCDP